jgi:sortase B
MRKVIRILLLILFTGLLLYSAANVIDIALTYREGKDSYDSLEQFVSLQNIPQASVPGPTADPVTGEFPTPGPDETESAPETAENALVDFDTLAEINPDIVGWIYIPGTNINYPVVQGRDNDYYLNHLFDGTVNAAGCIFLDAANASEFTDPHTIIYGHHMKDDTMFADLVRYKQGSFYQEHPTATLVTRDRVYTIQLFSGYVCDDWADAWKLDFGTGEFETWLSQVCDRSYFRCEAKPGPEDQILTLSTCTYEFEDAKFVLHGYIVKDSIPTE